MKYIVIMFLFIGCSPVNSAIDMADENPGKEICFKLYTKTVNPRTFCVTRK